MSNEYPETCSFCGVPYRIYSADEGTCSIESEYFELKKLLKKDEDKKEKLTAEFIKRNHKNVGNNIMPLRLMAGLTQSQLAKLSEFTLTTIKDFESGRRQPSIRAIQRLAKALNCMDGEISYPPSVGPLNLN